MSDNDISTKDTSIRKRVSLVWQYFEKLSSVLVKCRICQHEQRYMGNTANALRHLKAKHDIDVRPIGLQDPENVKRMKLLNVSSSIPFEETIAGVSIKNESRFNDEDDVEQDHDEHEDVEEELEKPEIKQRRNRQQISYYETDGDIDPYVHNEEPLVDYVDTNNYHNNIKNQEDSLDFNRNSKTSTSKRKRTSLEDERIIAETEYFREKAAYFRVQKHLAALQARKIKFELEQMCSK